MKSTLPVMAQLGLAELDTSSDVRPKVQGNGNLLAGKADTTMLELNPGDSHLPRLISVLVKGVTPLVLLLVAHPALAVPLPLTCELTSEHDAAIRIRLTERTAFSLKGVLIQHNKPLGTFQTGQSRGNGNVWWSFQDQHGKADGVSVLFKDDQHWNPYRPIPKPSETNRVLFAGWAADLWSWNNPGQPGVFRGNRDLLRAAAGFWSISDQCLGGRMMRG
jgi:hypothetical protein